MPSYILVDPNDRRCRVVTVLHLVNLSSEVADGWRHGARTLLAIEASDELADHLMSQVHGVAWHMDAAGVARFGLTWKAEPPEQ